MLLRRRQSKWGQVLLVPTRPARRPPAMWGELLLIIHFRFCLRQQPWPFLLATPATLEGKVIDGTQEIR